MDKNTAAVFSAAKQGNAVAMEKARAKLPKLEVNELISTVMSVWNAKENRQEAALKAAKQLARKYQKPMEVYLNAFAVFTIKKGLQNFKYQDIPKLGTEEFAQKIVDAAKNVEKAVADYCHGNLKEEDFIICLGQTGVLEVRDDFLQAAGLAPDDVKEKVQAVFGGEALGAGVLMVSFCASAAAYKQLKEALQDASIMREDRLRMEEECARSIAQMREYRESMNATVSDYLYIHAETFNEGIAAMDRAILEGDVNGFIRGNVAIQEILNYKVQFRDQNEFDALMDADTAFVL